MKTTALVSITDTRRFDPETGRAEPGSGEAASCDCCGRAIVIHVHVADLEAVGPHGWKLLGTRTLGKACAAQIGVRSVSKRLPSFKVLDAETIAALAECERRMASCRVGAV